MNGRLGARRAAMIALVAAGLALVILAASSKTHAQEASTPEAVLGAGAFTTVVPNGDVMVSIGSGQVQVRKPDGTVDTSVANSGILDDTSGSGFTTGSAFDSSGNFFVTDFSSALVSKFDPAGNFLSTFGSGFIEPESILVNKAGHFFVGNAGSDTLKEFDALGNLANTFTLITENHGVDWIELAADQCTFFYTSEGVHVKRFNVCTNMQMPDFNPVALPRQGFGLRILPSGGLLAADLSAVIRLDASGNQIQTYTIPNTSLLFALNLDPDGTSFWTADLSSGRVARVDIASGNVLLNFVGGPPNQVAGLSVKGEITVAKAASADVKAPPPPTVTGSPGQTVDAGSFDLTNSSSGSESFNSVTITLTDPGLFSSLMLTATFGDSSQMVTVNNPTATTVFNFDTPVVLAAAQSAHFSLKGTIAMVVSSGEHSKVVFARMVPTRGTGGNYLTLALAAVLMTLSFIPAPIPQRRRIAIALTTLLMLGATQAGCDPCGTCAVMNEHSSTQTLTGVGGTDPSQSPVKVNGLPAGLGTVKV